jgi:hypothetical protein
MLQTVDIEVLLACLYALFLLVCAFGLELLARHSHHRSKQISVAGFKYHRQHDMWECPTGEQLKPVTTDHARRLTRYRAQAHVCNKCSIKHLCTESDDGREIEHDPGSWLESELAKFHRGISLALLFLAGLLLLVEMLRHQRPMELVVLGGCLGPVAFLGSHLSSAFFAARQG